MLAWKAPRLGTFIQQVEDRDTGELTDNYALTTVPPNAAAQRDRVGAAGNEQRKRPEATGGSRRPVGALSRPFRSSFFLSPFYIVNVKWGPLLRETCPGKPGTEGDHRCPEHSTT